MSEVQCKKQPKLHLTAAHIGLHTEVQNSQFLFTVKIWVNFCPTLTQRGLFGKCLG
jgi:hypothetical protein